MAAWLCYQKEVHVNQPLLSPLALKALPSRNNVWIHSNRKSTGNSSCLIVYEEDTSVAAGAVYERASVASATAGTVNRFGRSITWKCLWERARFGYLYFERWWQMRPHSESRDVLVFSSCIPVSVSSVYLETIHSHCLLSKLGGSFASSGRAEAIPPRPTA